MDRQNFPFNWISKKIDNTSHPCLLFHIEINYERENKSIVIEFDAMIDLIRINRAFNHGKAIITRVFPQYLVGMIMPPFTPLATQNGFKEWDLRQAIQSMQAAGQDIAAIIFSHPRLDASTKKIWQGDCQEAYNCVVSAFDRYMHARSRGQDATADQIHNYLDYASHKVLQVLSELQAIDPLSTNAVGQRWKASFDKCRVMLEFLCGLGLASRADSQWFPMPRRTKLGEQSYQLHCAECGKGCVSFQIGKDEFGGETEKLLFTGILSRSAWHINHAGSVFSFLEEDDLMGLQTYLKENIVWEGVDAYCPECDLVYCQDHYICEPVYDEGFYDCTYGTCPKGHRRMIDD